MTDDPPTCAGFSALHACGTRPSYKVHWPSGRRPDGAKVEQAKYACGRHLTWLVNRVTVPGRTVKVTRL